MRTYKVVLLNGKAHLTTEKELTEAESTVNRLVSDGWILQQVVNALDGMIGFFYKEEN